MDNRTLRVCHLTPTYFSRDSILGGGERYVNYVIQAVNAAAGLNRKISQDVISVASSAERSNLKTPILLENLSGNSDPMSRIPERLTQAIAGYDLVHVHQALTLFGEYCIAAAKSMGKKVVATDLGGGESELMLAGKGLELVDAVISISDFADELLAGYFTGPSEVIHGPVDTDYFNPSSVSPAETNIIAVGRILPHKGFDRIINSLPSDLPLKIVGSVLDPNYYQHLLDLGVGKTVEFVVDADDQMLLELYRQATVFVQASTHMDIYGNFANKPELLGLTTLEALSCGTPAIVSNAGSLPELIPNSTIGRVFDSPEALSNILGEVQRGVWPASDARLHARKFAVDQMSFSAVGGKFLSVYERLVFE